MACAKAAWLWTPHGKLVPRPIGYKFLLNNNISMPRVRHDTRVLALKKKSLLDRDFMRRPVLDYSTRVLL